MVPFRGSNRQHRSVLFSIFDVGTWFPFPAFEHKLGTWRAWDIPEIDIFFRLRSPLFFVMFVSTSFLVQQYQQCRRNGFHTPKNEPGQKLFPAIGKIFFSLEVSGNWNIGMCPGINCLSWGCLWDLRMCIKVPFRWGWTSPVLDRMLFLVSLQL